jgi:hypothetical protein
MPNEGDEPEVERITGPCPRTRRETAGGKPEIKIMNTRLAATAKRLLAENYARKAS